VSLNVIPGDHGSKAYAIPDDHPGLALAERVLEEVYGKRSLRVRMGATIPIGLIFRESIGAETVFFSFSTSDEDYHAPNEFFRLQRLDDGLKAWIRYWELLGKERWTYANIALARAEMFSHLAPGTHAALAPLLYAGMRERRISAEIYRGRWENIGTPAQLAALHGAPS